MTQRERRDQRIQHAYRIAAMADTVAILTAEEEKALVDRALSGEFDADIDLPREEYLEKFKIHG